jgi:hypothetical protein
VVDVIVRLAGIMEVQSKLFRLEGDVNRLGFVEDELKGIFSLGSSLMR